MRGRRVAGAHALCLQCSSTALLRMVVCSPRLSWLFFGRRSVRWTCGAMTHGCREAGWIALLCPCLAPSFCHVPSSAVLYFLFPLLVLPDYISQCSPWFQCIYPVPRSSGTAGIRARCCMTLLFIKDFLATRLRCDAAHTYIHTLHGFYARAMHVSLAQHPPASRSASQSIRRPISMTVASRWRSCSGPNGSADRQHARLLQYHVRPTCKAGITIRLHSATGP